jgi:hypothetical protein
LIVLALIAAPAAILAPRLGGKQTTMKAPLPPSKRAKRDKKPIAAWPAGDESAMRLGADSESAAANPAPASATAGPIGSPPSASPQASVPVAASPGGPPPARAASAAPPPAETPQKAPPHPVASPQPAPNPKPSASAPGAAAPKTAPAAPKPPSTAAAPTASGEEAKKLLTEAESFLRGDKLKDAEKQFRAVLASDPNLADAHSGLAMALYGLERDGPAGVEARKAIALNSAAARAHLVIGLIASNKQDIAGAKKAYKRYLELEPSGEYAEEVRRFLKAQH